MSHYWNQRFAEEGMIWGKEPSPSALWAMKYFREAGAGSVLVPGAGYGRNTKAFSGSFAVYGIEISEAALRQARVWDPATVFIAGSALEKQLEAPVDAIYCYDVLHLFLEEDRRRLIETSLAQLRPGGLLYFTCFSDEDPHCGIGPLLEPGTYEYKPGKAAHFFDEADLRRHFAGTEILAAGSFTERLHSDRELEHEYILRYIVARKLPVPPVNTNT